MPMLRIAQAGSGRPPTPKPPGSEKQGPPPLPKKTLPPPLPKPGGPAQGFQPQVRQQPKPPNMNPAEMSPETKAMMQEAISYAMKLKDRPDLPSNVRKEIMDLLDLSAHPALSKSKVTVQGAMIRLARRILSLRDALDDGMNNWERFASRRAVGPLGRKR